MYNNEARLQVVPKGDRCGGSHQALGGESTLRWPGRLRGKLGGK